MARNFDCYTRIHDRIQKRMDRWNRDRRFDFFHELRRRLYRSRDGKVLGVFRGIAESMGFSVCWTRIIGCVILLTLTDFFGAHGLTVTILVGGFFYLLTALLMQAPRAPGAMPSPARGGIRADDPLPMPYAGYAGSSPAGASYRNVYPQGRVDLAQLDRQIDSLNHRIQRMETVVTDRQFDWDRRMES